MGEGGTNWDSDRWDWSCMVACRVVRAGRGVAPEPGCPREETSCSTRNLYCLLVYIYTIHYSLRSRVLVAESIRGPDGPAHRVHGKALPKGKAQARWRMLEGRGGDFAHERLPLLERLSARLPRAFGVICSTPTCPPLSSPAAPSSCRILI